VAVAAVGEVVPALALGSAVEGEVAVEMSRHRNSGDNLPASRWGSPHTLHRQPTLRTSRCCRCMWTASAQAVLALVAEGAEGEAEVAVALA